MPEPRNDEATGDLPDLIGRFFATIRSGVDTNSLEVLVQLDLTLTQMRVMACLGETADPQPITEIADALDISLPTAGRSVDHLVRTDLAKRWEDPDDRRSKLVTLTDDGRALIEVHRAAIDTHIRAFSDALPDDVAEALATSIARALDAAPESFRASCTLTPKDLTPTDHPPAHGSTDESTPSESSTARPSTARPTSRAERTTP